MSWGTTYLNQYIHVPEMSRGCFAGTGFSKLTCRSCVPRRVNDGDAPSPKQNVKRQLCSRMVTLLSTSVNPSPRVRAEQARPASCSPFRSPVGIPVWRWRRPCHPRHRVRSPRTSRAVPVPHFHIRQYPKTRRRWN